MQSFVWLKNVCSHVVWWLDDVLEDAIICFIKKKLPSSVEAVQHHTNATCCIWWWTDEGTFREYRASIPAFLGFLPSHLILTFSPDGSETKVRSFGVGRKGILPYWAGSKILLLISFNQRAYCRLDVRPLRGNWAFQKPSLSFSKAVRTTNKPFL